MAQDSLPYACHAAYNPEHVTVGVLYCSDGRFGDQIEDFLHQGLLLPRYDRVAVPGSVAALAGHFAAWREEEAVKAQLQLLIEAHHLRRIVLIAHQDCGYYRIRLGLTGAAADQRQLTDLAKAAERIRTGASGVHVEGYFARAIGGRVVIDRVPV